MGSPYADFYLVPLLTRNLTAYRKMPFDMKRMVYGGFRQLV